MAKHTDPLVHGGPERSDSSEAGEPRSASLSDLIHLECVSGAREAVLVISNGRQGHLFFEGGAMIHARAAELVGDEAAFEIVSWKSGALSASDLPWPARPSITIPWQKLVTQALQSSDEHERVRSERVLVRHSTLRSSAPLFESVVPSGPSERASSNRPSPPARPRPPSGSMVVRRSPSAPPPQAARLAPNSAGAGGAVRRAARLDDQDALIALRGDAEELAQKAPGLRRAVAALGEVLGLQNFRSFECTFAGRQLMLYRDTGRSYIALEAAPGTNLEALRAAPAKH